MKQYTKRNKIMKMMRFDLKLTYAEIGKIFGLSRQRVAQILGKTGRIKKKDVYPINKDTQHTNKELAKKYDLSYSLISKLRGDDLHPLEENCPSSVSVENAIVVADFLREKGARVETKNIYKFDYHLVVNGKRVVIKTRQEPLQSPSLRNKNDLYVFHGDNGKRKNVDYYILIAGVEKRYHFVVPAHLIQNNQSIGVTWPAEYKSKWSPYYENWEALL